MRYVHHDYNPGEIVAVYKRPVAGCKNVAVTPALATLVWNDPSLGTVVVMATVCLSRYCPRCDVLAVTQAEDR